MAVTKNEYDFEALFNGMVSTLETRFASDVQYSDILDWYDNGGIDKEALGIEITKEQRLILAVYYGLTLTEEQQSILEFWKLQDRTTYDFDFGPVKRNNLVCEAGRRSGKCQRIDSLVQTKLGLLYLYEVLQMSINVECLTPTRLGLLSKQEILSEVRAHTTDDSWVDLNLEVSVEGKEKTSQATAFYTKGLSKTKKVTTACGYGIEATPEHRVKVVGEDGVIQWRFINDVKVGDYLCVHRSTFLFPEQYLDLKSFAYTPPKNASSFKDVELPELLDSTLGYLFGLLVANGSWTKLNCIEVTFHSQDIETYRNSYKANKLSNYSEAYDNRAKFAARLQFHSSKYRALLENLGWTQDCRPNTKKTPWSIRRSPKDVQAAYLSGLFDGDGSVEKDGRSITLSSASKQLAEETQLMLLNFGIVSRVKEKIVKGRPYYILSLRGQRSHRRFVEVIGFKLERKQSVVLDSLAKASRDGGDTERIPYQIEWLKRIRESLPNNMGCQPGSRLGLLTGDEAERVRNLPKLRNLRLEYRAIVGNAIKESAGELLSSYRLDKLIEFAEQFSTDREAVQHFKHLKDCDYFYDPVVSVEDSESFCVDLSVPGPHEYVSQGLTNHNSMMGSLIINYEFEKLCRMDSPQKHYGIASSTLISIICVAPSADQVSKTIYGQSRAMMYNVPFLRRLIELGKIDPQEKMVKYDEKLLYIYSGNSKSETQVGGSPILVVLDEGALFQDKDGDSNALTLWDNLGAGGLVFHKDAKRVIISSAWSETDVLVKLYKDAKESQSWIGFRLRTWDVNPIHGGRDKPVIDSMYISNRKMAELLYEGIRTASEDAYFNSDAVKAAFNIMSDLYARPLPDDGSGLVRVHIDAIGSYIGHTVMHLDPAVTRDNYALAYGHSEFIDGQLHVFIDGIIAWEPTPTAQVSILNVQSAIFQIHNFRPLAKVSSDDKESAETFQRLKGAGLSVEPMRFSNNKQLAIYSTTDTLLNERRLHLPKNSPWTRLLKEEMLKVELIKGMKIDHPSNGSKDLLDCVAAVCWHLAGKGQEDLMAPLVLNTKSLSKKQPDPLSVPDVPAHTLQDFRRDLYSRKRRWTGLKSNSDWN